MIYNDKEKQEILSALNFIREKYPNVKFMVHIEDGSVSIIHDSDYNDDNITDTMCNYLEPFYKEKWTNYFSILSDILNQIEEGVDMIEIVNTRTETKYRNGDII